MKNDITDGLDVEIENVLIVQQVTIIETLFLLAIAAIIGFATLLYYPGSNRQHISKQDHAQSISMLSSTGN